MQGSVEFRSKGVHDCIGQIPPWLIKVDMMAIFLINAGLIFMCLIIRFPDTFSVRVQIERKNNATYYGKSFITESMTGKIREGQKINIEFLEFPINVWGVLQGNISHVSETPENGKYAVFITLPQNLVTNSNIKLQYQQGMVGNGEISLKKIRIIDKICFRFGDN